MFDDLNDPFPPASTDGSRQGVAARVRRIRRIRALVGGGASAALVGVVALVLLQSGGSSEKDTLIPAVSSSPSAEVTAEPTPVETTAAPTPSATATTSPSAEVTVAPVLPPRPTPTDTPLRTATPSAAPAGYVWPANPHAPQYFAAEDCSVSPMEPAGPPAFAGGTLVTHLQDKSSATYGEQSGAELRMTNPTGVVQHVLAVETNLWALIDAQGHQVAHLSRWYDTYERYTLAPGQSTAVSPMGLWPADCPGAQPQFIAPGTYTLLGGLRVTRADGSVSVWWAAGVPVTITSGPTPTATP